MDRSTSLRGTLLASALIVGSVAAQGMAVVPATHAVREGSAGTNIPFGRGAPTRVQYVYDANLIAAPVTITGVRLRLDGGASSAGKIVDCEVSMSTCPASLLALSTQFEQNRGTDEVLVLPRQLLALPAQASSGSPGAFSSPIRFGAPFSYDPQSGPLVLEIAVHGQPPGAYSLDATFVCSSPSVSVGPPSCLQSNGAPLRVESATTGVHWGRPWVVRAFDADPGDVVVLALGSQESGMWAGMQLPQDLALVGARGCYVSIDIAASFYGYAVSDGSVTFPFVIPNNPQLLGEWLRFQAAALDPAANSLGLVTSQAQKVQVCGWERVGRVWSSGVSQAFGTLELGLAAVAQFTTQ